MKLKPEQIAAHLNKGLAPVYLLAGDEPLQLLEAGDAIRAHARSQGFTEREVLTVDKGFDWDSLLQASGSMSLFGDKRILELKMPGGKPGDKGSKALQAYVADLPPDTILLVICGKLESAATRSKWCQALERVGAFIQVWPVEIAQLPQWVMGRMQARGMQATREAATLLADRVEGNLLAAAQEIEKLLLLHGQGRIDVDEVAAAVTDSARFNIFSLVDCALAGKPQRLARMLNGLRGEGIDPILVHWALTREIRSLTGMAAELAAGDTIESVLARHRVWERRKPLLRGVLKRHSLKAWRAQLQRCALLDRVIKGAELGNRWDELLQLGMWLSGAAFIRPQ